MSPLVSGDGDGQHPVAPRLLRGTADTGRVGQSISSIRRDIRRDPVGDAAITPAAGGGAIASPRTQSPRLRDPGRSSFANLRSVLLPTKRGLLSGITGISSRLHRARSDFSFVPTIAKSRSLAQTAPGRRSGSLGRSADLRTRVGSVHSHAALPSAVGPCPRRASARSVAVVADLSGPGGGGLFAPPVNFTPRAQNSGSGLKAARFVPPTEARAMTGPRLGGRTCGTVVRCALGYAPRRRVASE